jgi:hypothetical protein
MGLQQLRLRTGLGDQAGCDREADGRQEQWPKSVLLHDQRTNHRLLR